MRRRPWPFYGWFVVAGTVLVMALASGTRMSFGVALVPLSEQFGWTRTTLSTIALVTGVITGLLQIIMGVLVDRVGPRLVLACGVTLLGIGVWLLTFATSVWQFGVAYGLLAGIGFAGTQQVVTTPLVANWFVQHRAFVQSMISSAMAVGWMIVVPANLFIERTYGWTTMYRVMGTVLLVGTAPFIWGIIRNRPEDMGLQPLGAAAAVHSATTPTPLHGLSLGQAMQHVRTWKLMYLGFA